MRNFTWPRARVDRRPGTYKFVLAWSALAVTGGIALAATGATDLYRVFRQNQWPVVDGRVESVTTMPYTAADGEITIVRKTAYAYAVGNRTLRAESSEIVPKDSLGKIVQASAPVRRFRNTKVAVHVNPEDASLSWIDQGPVPVEILILAFVLFAAGVVTGAIGFHLRKLENELVSEGTGRVISPPDGPRRWILPGTLATI